MLAGARSRFLAPDSLHANANALIVSTALTSVAGFGFWALAARWLPTEAVGIGTALISVLTLLANLATLGLRNGLVRFLPSSGSSARRLILGSYLASGAAAVVMSGVFLLGQPRWADHLGFLRHSALTAGVFIVATVVWVLFVLQDDVLVGLRKSLWVPVENLTYSIVKIAMLPLLAVSATWTVFTATVLPAAVAVVAVTVLLLRLTRRPGVESVRPRVSVHQLVRFAAADQVAWLISACTIPVLTLIVLKLQGPEASAYFYLANMIGYSLYLVTSNIGSALIAESAHEPERATTHARTALGHSLRIVVPLAATGILLGPIALRVVGGDYAAHAGPALQLIILSAIPQTIVGISISTARVRRQLSTVVFINIFLAVTIWGGSWLTLPAWGVTGVGVTILAAQTVAAIGLVMTGHTGLGSIAETASTGWAAASRMRGALRRPSDRRAQRRVLPPVLAACGICAAPEVRALKSDSDTMVLAVTDGPVESVLKIATSEAADRNLTRHADIITDLREHCGSDYLTLLPEVVERARVGRHLVVRETLLPGQSLGGDPGGAAIAAISRLHTATARYLAVSPALSADWVDRPVNRLLEHYTGAQQVEAIKVIAGYLRAGFDDAQVTVSFTHGDYWPGNVLISDAGGVPVVTGIVDWENGTEVGLPDADLVHWYLATRPDELGTVVCSVLDAPEQLGRYFDELGVVLPNPHLDPGSVVMFVWLWHVANMLTRKTSPPPGRCWGARNVLPVLRRFEVGTSRSAAEEKGRASAHRH